MKKRELLSRIGVVVAATTLMGASVFGESRHSNETRGRRGEHGRIQRESSGERSRATRRDNSSNVERRSQRRETAQSDSRVEVRGDRYRNTDRSERYNRENRSNREWRDRGNYDRNNRNNDRSRSYDRSRSHDRSYGRSSGYRQPYYGHGRVSRVHRYGGGYRVWIVGAPYPFYIPLAYYRHDRFRVGLSISLGGYYNDGGYYDYYDGYSNGYSNGYRNGYSDGAMRGVVESVDYRRDSFVVRNDATGSFVTVLSRDRRLDVRAGDYVELQGEWTRSGVFTAWDVDFLEDGYRR